MSTVAMMNGAAPDQVTRSLTGSFLNSVMHPSSNQVPPPDIYQRVYSLKQVLVNANFEVDDSLLSVSIDRIPTNKGLVLWMPWRPVQNCVTRYGFLPANTTKMLQFTNTLAYAGNGLHGMHYFPNVKAAGWAFPISQLHFTQELAIPYNRNFPSEVIASAPDMDSFYDQTLNYSGQITVFSSTIAGGTLPLNGWVSASANSSTADIAQDVNDGAYGSVACSQAALAAKESLVDEPAYVGVTMLQGPEIPTEFAPPNNARVDFMHGVWTSGTSDEIAAGIESYDIGPTSDPTGEPHPFANYWITPWAIEATGNDKLVGNANAWEFVTGQVFSAVGNIQVSPIGERDNLDVVVEGNFYISPGASSSEYQVGATATHVYATIGNTYQGAGGKHNLMFRCEQETHITGVFRVNSNDWAGVPGGGQGEGPVNHLNAHVNNAKTQFKFSPKRFAGDPTDAVHGGKYLGTLVTVHWTNISGGFTALPDHKPICANVSIDVRARQIASASALGPARILRWDRVSDGQVMQVNGRLNCLAISKASAAPLTTSSQSPMGPQRYDTLLYVRDLFDRVDSIRRINRREVYQRLIVDKFSRGVTQESLLEWATANPTSAAAGEAAGLFSTLGGFFGPVGAAVGSVGDTVFGTGSGMFGADRGQAAGMFGAERRGRSAGY